MHLVEQFRGALAALACTKSRHVAGLLLHTGQRRAPPALCAGSSRTRTIMGILQLCIRSVGVRKHPKAVAVTRGEIDTVAVTPPWTM